MLSYSINGIFGTLAIHVFVTLLVLLCNSPLGEDFMRENICSKAQIDNIATELNAGRRTEAVDLINDCTQNLINDSAYGKFMKEHGDKVKAGEKPATNAATVLFDLVTAEESTMWKGMAKAADNKNPDGLCKMTVAKDKRGTFIEIGGKDCR